MRISDWSSDVCSSDLISVMFFGVGARQRDKVGNLRAERPDVNILILGVGFYAPTGAVCCIELHRIKSIFRGCNLGVSGVAALYRQIGSASCRERVCQYV